MNIRSMIIRRMSCLILALSCATVAPAALPAGWQVAGNAPQDYLFDVDSNASDGRRSALIVAKPEAQAGKFGTLLQSFSAEDYRGKRLRLSGAMRTEDAARAQMWMRVDGPQGKMLAFDNMDDRPLTGTSGWQRYEIVLDVPEDAVAIFYGFFLMTKGKVWADDFRFETVAATVSVTGSAAVRPRQPTNTSFEK